MADRLGRNSEKMHLGWIDVYQLLEWSAAVVATGESMSLTKSSRFKIGDRVILKSGGPTMKVIGHSPNGNVWCEWQGSMGVEEASFTPETIHFHTVSGSSESG